MIKKNDADDKWFIKWFNSNKKESFEKALKKSLNKIEDKGINLAKVFSLNNHID